MLQVGLSRHSPKQALRMQSAHCMAVPLLAPERAQELHDGADMNDRYL